MDKMFCVYIYVYNMPFRKNKKINLHKKFASLDLITTTTKNSFHLKKYHLDYMHHQKFTTQIFPKINKPPLCLQSEAFRRISYTKTNFYST